MVCCCIEDLAFAHKNIRKLFLCGDLVLVPIFILQAMKSDSLLREKKCESTYMINMVVQVYGLLLGVILLIQCFDVTCKSSGELDKV